MPCIQSRYHYSHTVLNGVEILHGRTLLGDKVRVLGAGGRDDDYQSMTFRGFVGGSALNGAQGVEYVDLCNINAFTLDESGISGWEYCNSHLVGVLCEGGCKLLLVNGKPVPKHKPEAPQNATESEKGKVVSLSAWRGKSERK